MNGPPQPNFRSANWAEVREDLVIRLADMELRDEIQTIGEFYTCINALTCTITESIDSTVPKIWHHCTKSVGVQGVGQQA